MGFYKPEVSARQAVKDLMKVTGQGERAVVESLVEYLDHTRVNVTLRVGDDEWRPSWAAAVLSSLLIEKKLKRRWDGYGTEIIYQPLRWTSPAYEGGPQLRKCAFPVIELIACLTVYLKPKDISRLRDMWGYGEIDKQRLPALKRGPKPRLTDVRIKLRSQILQLLRADANAERTAHTLIMDPGLIRRVFNRRPISSHDVRRNPKLYASAYNIGYRAAMDIANRAIKECGRACS